jgi:hypothetical protein
MATEALARDRSQAAMIVRSPRPITGWTVFDNRTLRDSRLSIRARGLLCYLLSFPDNWSVNSEIIAKDTAEGRDAIRRALQDLEAAGYITRHKERSAAGRIITVTTVYDRPVDNSGDTEWIKRPPAPEKPAPENPSPIEGTTKKEHKKSRRVTRDWQVCTDCAGTGFNAGLTECSCKGGLTSVN